MNDLSSLKFVDCDNQQKMVNIIINQWKGSNRHFIVNFIYYSNFILLKKNVEYFKSLQLSDFILIDGIGMQLYFNITKGFWPTNLNGTDLSPILLQSIDQLKIPISLYGTTPKNIEMAKINISKFLINESIYYICDGFSDLNWMELKDNSVLFVGLGSPLQENWVRNNLQKIEEKKLLVITVGGYFDFASGFYIRAPKWIRFLKLEWAWRTMLHPGRHLKKRINDLTIFYRPVIDRITGKARSIHVTKF
jgi:exopolysaccharide biosynthesis WecB/TagA/CpsF family protein